MPSCGIGSGLKTALLNRSPGERVREIFGRGVEIATKHVDEGRGRLVDGIVIVYREGEIPTVVTILDASRYPGVDYE